MSEAIVTSKKPVPTPAEQIKKLKAQVKELKANLKTVQENQFQAATISEKPTLLSMLIAEDTGPYDDVTCQLIMRLRTRLAQY